MADTHTIEEIRRTEEKRILRVLKEMARDVPECTILDALEFWKRNANSLKK